MIEKLFTKYLNPGSSVDDTINELAMLIDAEPGAQNSDQYYNVNDNEIRGFFDNDNFYIIGINNHELTNYVQFDY